MPPPPAAKQQQQSSGGGDDSLDFLWLVALLVVGTYALWYFGKSQITQMVFQIRYAEIKILHLIADGWSAFTSWANAPAMNLQKLRYWIAYIQDSSGSVEFQTLRDLSNRVGAYYRWPVAVILSILAALVYGMSTASKFKSIYTMKKMRDLEVANWPYLTPVQGIDLVKESISEGPWRMGITPVKFAKQHNVCREVTKRRKLVLELLPDPAFRVFSLQLGPLWTAPTQQPIHVQALFVVFCAKACAESDKAEALLRHFSSTSGGGKPDFSGVRHQVLKYLGKRIVAEVVYRHAYVYTVMAGLLQLARMDGVLATSEFLWLKPMDRSLWYALNDVGRQTASLEAAGTAAHLLAEKKFGRPIKTPMVKEAVRALEFALTEIQYEPNEEQ